MKKSIISLLCAVSLAGMSLPSLAGTYSDTSTPGMHAPGKFQKFKNMSREERRAHRAEVKQKWDKLTPQEKAAFREKNKEKLQKMRAKGEKRAEIRLYGEQLNRKP